MSFSRVKPGGWVEPDPLTAAEITQLDVNASQAIDGASGGVYAPSSAIEIGGAGLIADPMVTASLSVEGTVTISGGPVTIEDELSNATVLEFTGKSRMRRRVLTYSSSVSTALGANDADIILIGAGCIGHSCTFEAPAAVGDEFEIVALSALNGDWTITFGSVGVDVPSDIPAGAYPSSTGLKFSGISTASRLRRARFTCSAANTWVMTEWIWNP